MRARTLLHVCAFAVPLTITCAISVLWRNGEFPRALVATAALALPALVAAQLAAWMRWTALERRAISNGRGWMIGLGMAAITHLLFGLLLALGMNFLIGPVHWKDWENWMKVPVQGLFFSLASLTFAGAVTFPATAWIAQRVVSVRHQELARDPV